MNLNIFASITSITTAILLVAFLLIQLAVNLKESNRSNQIRRQLLKIAKKQVEQRVCVVVELNRAAVNLIGFLDGLYGQKYSSLELIIIVKQTAGKNAIADLVRYRRANHIGDFHIIKYRRGLKKEDIISHYSSGSIVMLMHGDECLSDNFFGAISMELETSVNPVLLCKQFVALDKTTSSALRANFNMMKQIIVGIFGVKCSTNKLQSGLVYKRSFIFSGNISRLEMNLNTSQFAYVSRKTKFNMMDYINRSIDSLMQNIKTFAGFVAYIVFAAGAICLVIFSGWTNFFVIFAFVLILYMLTSLTIYFRQTSYSLIDNLNLILIVPIAALFCIFVYICGGLKLVIIGLQLLISRLSGDRIDQNS